MPDCTGNLLLAPDLDWVSMGGRPGRHLCGLSRRLKQVFCYSLITGFSFLARARIAFGFSVRRSRRSGCLAASAALAASALVKRPLAGTAFVEEASALRFAISLSFRPLMHSMPPELEAESGQWPHRDAQPAPGARP